MGCLKVKTHAVSPHLLRVACRLRRLRSNAQQFAVLARRLCGVSKSRFLRELWRFRAGGTRADALQCAMKRGHVSDLQLDFSLSGHGVANVRPGLLSPVAEFR